MTQIAFIGIGNIGHPMALNLIKAGHSLRIFDIVPEVMAPVAQAGAVPCASIAEVVQGAEVVITMLPEGRHVRSAFLGDDGIIRQAPAGALLVDSSTIDVETARAVAATAAEAGFDLLDAPVSGGVTGAEAATLTFMVGGPEGAFVKARPLLAAMGKNIVHIGAAGSGQAVKICNNMMVAISTIASAEALTLGQNLGVDAQKLFDVISTSTGANWAWNNMYPAPGIVPTAPVNRDFAPGFKAALMAKDLGLAQSAATQTGTSTPLGATAASLFRLMCQQGRGELDFSGVIRLVNGDTE